MRFTSLGLGIYIDLPVSIGYLEYLSFFNPLITELLVTTCIGALITEHVHCESLQCIQILVVGRLEA